VIGERRSGAGEFVLYADKMLSTLLETAFALLRCSFTESFAMGTDRDQRENFALDDFVFVP